jgi:hypothetical protein
LIAAAISVHYRLQYYTANSMHRGANTLFKGLEIEMAIPLFIIFG